VAAKVAECVVGIYVFLDAECISRGSGFLFNDEGLVFTAAHVLNSGKPFSASELADPKLRIMVKIRGRPIEQYHQGMPSLLVDSDAFKDRLMIDLAGLNPIRPPSTPTPHLVTKIRPPVLGEPVLIAGFSDEAYPPFAFPQRLKPSLEGFPALMAARHGAGFDVDLGLLLVKSGIVASSFGYTFGGKKGEVKGHTFFVDNGLHSGASGGPVVDAAGEVFGVVTERSVTRLGHGPQPDLLVPAGSTHALTIEPLLAIK
jgi:hypothetical protein